jgi:hypothetical protein
MHQTAELGSRHTKILLRSQRTINLPLIMPIKTILPLKPTLPIRFIALPSFSK